MAKTKTATPAPVLSNATVPRPTPTGIETLLGWYDTTWEAVKKENWGLTGQTQIVATRTFALAFAAAEEAAATVEQPKPGNGTLALARQAAIAFAIHDSLVSLTPRAKALVDQQLDATIASLPEGTKLNGPRNAGEAAAASWTTKRLGDGLDLPTINRPFNIPAPANGVWRLTSPGGYVSILRDVLTRDKRSPRELAHIVKVFHEVTGDAQIAIYASKYRYLRWRPVTALTTDDGNPATPFIKGWTPLITTPAHPEYPSGHVGYAAAAEVALQTFFGKTPAKPVRAQSTVFPGVFTAYTSWGEITDDNVNARVWSGIHLRSTDNISRRYGYKIARAALRAAGELK